MRLVFAGFGGMMLAGVFADVLVARAAQPMNQCHQVALRCKEQGLEAWRCQRQVDECMNRHACEEVYYSCLELMELEEGLTEQACERKRDKCTASRKQS